MIKSGIFFTQAYCLAKSSYPDNTQLKISLLFHSAAIQDWWKSTCAYNYFIIKQPNT